jgi:uncharacterized protein YjbI with pentapeptide repeats
VANPEHLAIIKSGVAGWNEWRLRNREVSPDLSGADLIRADLEGASLEGANLTEASLEGASLEGANLTEASLEGANLTEANLKGANLKGAILSRADLAGADLSRADLQNADLQEVDCMAADFSYANLSGSELFRANFSGAVLAGADCTGADLALAYLGGANLTQANLSGADLSEATLVRTKLTHTNLTGCRVYGLSAWDVHLEKTIQSGLVITESDDSIITVDDLEVAQFLYLLLNNQKIRHVIDTITSKVVLVLGRFTPERKAVLDAIRDELTQAGLHARPFRLREAFKQDDPGDGFHAGAHGPVPHR